MMSWKHLSIHVFKSCLISFSLLLSSTFSDVLNHICIVTGRIKDMANTILIFELKRNIELQFFMSLYFWSWMHQRRVKAFFIGKCNPCLIFNYGTILFMNGFTLIWRFLIKYYWHWMMYSEYSFWCDIRGKW